MSPRTALATLRGVWVILVASLEARIAHRSSEQKGMWAHETGNRLHCLSRKKLPADVFTADTKLTGS